MPNNLLHRTNLWVWYSKIYKNLHLIPCCITVKVNGTTRRRFNTWKATTRFRIKQELKFLCKKKIRNFKNFTLHVQLCDIMTGNWFSEVLSCMGACGGVVVKALCYKPAGRGFDSRWCHWNFSVTSFRSHYGPGVDSASNRNEYQVYFLGVKAAGA
jgi:hypothetical protein